MAITFDDALGFSLTTNDVLVINTKTWTVTKNGTNYLDKVKAGSEFFWLESGDQIEITGTGTIDLLVAHKDRWV
jgi:phage-related protein